MFDLETDLLNASLCHAGAEGERSASADHKDRRLLNDIPDCDCCLGCSYQVGPHYCYYSYNNGIPKVHYGQLPFCLTDYFK